MDNLKTENFWDLDKQIIEAKQQVDYWGTVITQGKTEEEIAHIDEQFFLAIEKLTWLKGRRDVRVFVWKPINTFNLQENESTKKSHVSSHCRKRMKNT